MDPDRLYAAARAVRASAYAPYSEFHVGAALEASDGTVFVGSNVENGSYGLTMCAERVAVFTAVVSGRRSFTGIAIVTSGGAPVAPCGACRQVLAEFAPGMTVYSEAGGTRTEWTLDELLPARFEGPSQSPRK